MATAKPIFEIYLYDRAVFREGFLRILQIDRLQWHPDTLGDRDCKMNFRYEVDHSEGAPTWRYMHEGDKQSVVELRFFKMYVLHETGKSAGNMHLYFGLRSAAIPGNAVWFDDIIYCGINETMLKKIGRHDLKKYSAYLPVLPVKRDPIGDMSSLLNLFHDCVQADSIVMGNKNTSNYTEFKISPNRGYVSMDETYKLLDQLGSLDD